VKLSEIPAEVRAHAALTLIMRDLDTLDVEGRLELLGQALWPVDDVECPEWTPRRAANQWTGSAAAA
jgi:hypothetical protein